MEKLSDVDEHHWQGEWLTCQPTAADIIVDENRRNVFRALRNVL
jgi:hypothetical protein